MKTVEINGKDLSEITDYKSLVEIRETVSQSKNFTDTERVLYISPKNEVVRKAFEFEFVKSNKNVKLLLNDTLLRKMFSSYETMDVELYVYSGTTHNEQAMYRLSFIDFVLGNYSNPKFL